MVAIFYSVTHWQVTTIVSFSGVDILKDCSYYICFFFSQMLDWHFNLSMWKFWVTYNHNSYFFPNAIRNSTLFIFYNYFSDIFYILKTKTMLFKNRTLYITLLWKCQEDIDCLTKGKIRGMCKSIYYKNLRENSVFQTNIKVWSGYYII